MTLGAATAVTTAAMSPPSLNLRRVVQYYGCTLGGVGGSMYKGVVVPPLVLGGDLYHGCSAAPRFGWCSVSWVT